MDTPELVVWSAMLGGLATLAAFALVDALIRRSIAAWRAFIFVGLTGAVCILLTGLTQTLFPDFPLHLLRVLQASLGLFSARWGHPASAPTTTAGRPGPGLR